MDKEMKLAVLIDAENIASKYVEVILREANNLGNVIYRRAYGNWTTQQMSSWRDVILDNSIQPIQQYSNVSGKNSTDSSLIIDAMDLLFQGRLDGFCIASSDSDFTRLAARLRESEMYVFGMGERKTPRSFISACNKFSYLDLLYSSSSPARPKKEKPAPEEKTAPEKPAEKPAPEKPAEKPAPEEKKAGKDASDEENAGSNLEIVKRTLKELAEENSDDDGWIFSAKLKGLLNRRFPDFDERNFGRKKFVPFIQSLKLFETKKVPMKDGSLKLVYFKLIG